MMKTSSQGPNALVVDDHALSRRFSVVALRQVCRSVSQAEEGSQAIAQAGLSHPELIYMDIHLPDMPGLLAIRQIRRHWPAGLHQPRVIIVTADDSVELRNELSREPVDQLLVKPVRLETLLASAGNGAMDHTRDMESAGSRRDTSVDKKLQAMFQSELREQLPLLDTWIADLEWVSAGRVLHQLIASSAICGQRRLERHCRELYEAVIAGDGPARIAQAYYPFLLEADRVRLFPVAG